MSAPTIKIGLFGTDTVAPQTLAGTGTHELAVTIQNNGITGKRTITVTAGVNALTGLKVSVAAKPGGTHVDRVVDGDFDTLTPPDRFDATSGLSTLGAGQSGQFDLDFTGWAEVKIWAKGTLGTTVAFEIANP